MTTRTLSEEKAQPYWANCKPEDPHCKRFNQRNREDLEYWCELLPQDEDAFAMSVIELSTRTGMSKYMVEQAFQGAAISQSLPKLREQALKWGHLEMRYFYAIDHGLTGVAAEMLPDFDDALEWFFTPIYPEQVLPCVKDVKRFLEELKINNCPGYGVAHGEDYELRGIKFVKGVDGLADIKGLVSNEEAAVIDAALDNTARKYDIDRVEALVKIITEKVDVTAYLNYWSPAPDQEPTYLDGVGHLRYTEMKVFDKLNIKQRDLTGVDDVEVDGYRPSEKQKAKVRLRDGLCRFPDCQRPASVCEIDHVTEYDGEEGLTVVKNLQCLCPFHHNLKTSGDYTVFMNHNGVCRWFMPNGSVRVTLPQGPEAHQSKAHFGQRWGNRKSRPKTAAEAEKLFKVEAEVKAKEAEQAWYPNREPYPLPEDRFWFDYKKEVIFEKPWAPDRETQPALPPARPQLALCAPPPTRRKKDTKLRIIDGRIPEGLQRRDEHAPLWVQNLHSKVEDDVKQRKEERKFASQQRRLRRLWRARKESENDTSIPPF